MSAPPAPLVLLVDDAPEVRQVFARFLLHAGMAVQQAEDGADALSQVRQQLPDAIVCDLDMPKMGGVAFCRALRADPATRHVPVLVVSGTGAFALAEALAAGCDVVLSKPCSGALLVATIARLLGGVRAATPPVV